MEQMKTLNGYEIVDEWARAQIGYMNGTTDSKYFDIDANGVLSLKAQYRGNPEKSTYPNSISDMGFGNNGSEIYKLPKIIILPENINGVAIKSLADGMFYGNSVVEEIAFPNTITVIPTYFCRDTKSLKKIKNTEHITTIGASAFMNSRLEEALFPNLAEAGNQVFTQTPYLRTAHIGKLQTIPLGFFASSQKLSTVKGGESVKQIGDSAFETTYNLIDIPFLSQLKVVTFGKRAFFNSKIQFDWSKYPSTSLGANATPIADNTTDYWSKTIGNRYYTPCENRLVTLLHQRHPLWTNEPMGNTGTTWLYGCGNFCVIHIHSALTGKKYATPFEFEAELEGKTTSDGTPLLNLYANNTENSKKLYEGLGYTTTAYTGVLDEAAFRNILDSLANGAYIHVSQSTTSNVNSGHATIGYGINKLGEIMFANSDMKTDKVGVYNDGFIYEMPLQNITGPDSDIIIVRKP